MQSSTSGGEEDGQDTRSAQEKDRAWRGLDELPLHGNVRAVRGNE